MQGINPLPFDIRLENFRRMWIGFDRKNFCSWILAAGKVCEKPDVGPNIDDLMCGADLGEIIAPRHKNIFEYMDGGGAIAYVESRSVSEVECPNFDIRPAERAKYRVTIAKDAHKSHQLDYVPGSTAQSLDHHVNLRFPVLRTSDPADATRPNSSRFEK